MSVEDSSKKTYELIVGALSSNPALKVDDGHQNYFGVKRGNTNCTVRIIDGNQVRLELYCANQQEHWVYYNMAEVAQNKNFPYKVELETFEDGISGMFKLRSKKLKIDETYQIPEQLPKIKEVCEWLLDFYDECANIPHRRQLIEIDSNQEVEQKTMLEFLDKFNITLALQKKLIELGKLGITCPSGKPNSKKAPVPFRARLWVDAEYAEQLPGVTLDSEEWSPNWKPKSYLGAGVTQIVHPSTVTDNYWLLVANPAVWSFKSVKIGEEFEFLLCAENGTPRQKINCFQQVKAGDKVLCYSSTKDKALVSLARISSASDGNKIMLVKESDITPPIPRLNLIQHKELKIFETPRFTLSDISKEQYELVCDLINDRKVEDSISSPRNRILFGAPGTGKSYVLKQQAEEFFKPENVERVTFHPEYSYFDFVGSYKPKMEGEGEAERIKYRFVPGPFIRILKESLAHPEQNYLLVIEEINRARVAAVFGDVFQLLDRNADGASEYGISPSEELKAHLKMEDADKLQIPANLYIWATMNSADQGVYPMDTAFKRRWNFEYQGIDEGREKVSGTHADAWHSLRENINMLLQEAGVNEDKQMGPFFMSPNELNCSAADFLAAFKNKVIMYLFEDAAKHKRDQVFRAKAQGKRYSEVCTLCGKDTLNAAAILRDVFGVETANPTSETTQE